MLASLREESFCRPQLFLHQFYTSTFHRLSTQQCCYWPRYRNFGTVASVRTHVSTLKSAETAGNCATPRLAKMPALSFTPSKTSGFSQISLMRILRKPINPRENAARSSKMETTIPIMTSSRAHRPESRSLNGDPYGCLPRNRSTELSMVPIARGVGSE
ncbi:hypothetical protein K469DRAFT_169451 [Zopfia rhizophila CBS 207.26]|uniref:Uncharacterized protein n=1 Tax=Zopfia rhizophila CBS 207.26 TaxID=1314779 RepID=A0A6A6E598_9PEZI|nr:hypothetical protein K469DRAFT_169451 [Zopfia rhizophila CBS 207.26]